METRICRLCKGDPKPITDFYENRVTRGVKVYVTHRTECRKCTDERTRQYHQENRDRVILNNCRKFDKARGQETDITREEIRALIILSCEYCGDRNDKMGIDRVDSQIGHVQGNVVPCCLRCNCIKRDMPLEAWQLLQPVVKQAFEAGLFKEWIGHNAGSGERGKRRATAPYRPDRRFRENRV